MSFHRTIIRLSAVLASLALGWACGDDGTTGPTPEPNRAPLAAGTIPAQTVAVGQTATRGQYEPIEVIL